MIARLLQTTVDTIFPPRCPLCSADSARAHGLCAHCLMETPVITGPVCDQCGVPVLALGAASTPERCDDCLTIGRPWSRGRAALRYAGNARRLVLLLKHADRLDLVRTVTPFLAQAARPLVTSETLLVPVPLHWRRLFARRYNQAALLCLAMARHHGLGCCNTALERIAATPGLDHKGRDERFALLHQKVRPAARDGKLIEGRDVLLVDDVMTTGATLAACAEACHIAGARKVDIMVLARVSRQDEEVVRNRGVADDESAD